MAADNLTLEISPSLLEAMDLPGASGKLDYFIFFGLNPDQYVAADIDRVVMARSKALRPWQNSPQHGAETIKLLPMLHRIAAVLKDAARAEAYKRELDRMLGGARIDPLAEFTDMVRAAMADGRLDQASKAELLRYATEHGIAMNDAGRILNDITAATARAPESDEDMELFWEEAVTTSRSGPQAFRAALASLIENGVFNAETSARIVQDAGKFSVSRADASTIVLEMGMQWFRDLVKHVARNGVLNDNQARLLMPKAKAVGLDQTLAYEILSDYTFTSASQQDLATLHLVTPSFDQSDIVNLLSKQKTVLSVNRFEFLRRLFGGAFGKAALVLALVAGLGYGGVQFLLPALTGGSGFSGPARATPAPISSPTVAPKAWQARKPDPASGLLAVPNETISDPPTFQIKIAEVTCAEYQEFVDKTLRISAPASWGVGLRHPDGTDRVPVTGITAKDAEDYCAWVAQSKGLAPGQVRLPKLDEYKRLLRFPAQDGLLAGTPGFWRKLGLSTSGGLAEINKHASDALYLPDGQVYDLIANAAEWSQDAKEGRRVVLGGDYTKTELTFDPTATRQQDPAKPSPEIGFRYVVTGSPR